jgi:hypothetical protein
MKWLYVTIGLLASSVCLIGWIYLRDRSTSSKPPAALSNERQMAHIAASITLSEIGGGCHPDCRAEVLDRSGAHLWLVRVTAHGRTRCLQINLGAFRVNGAHRLSGVRPRRCPNSAAPDRGDPAATAGEGHRVLRSRSTLKKGR